MSSVAARLVVSQQTVRQLARRSTWETLQRRFVASPALLLRPQRSLGEGFCYGYPGGWLSRRAASSAVNVDELKPGDFIHIKDRMATVISRKKVVHGRAAAYVQVEFKVHGETATQKGRFDPGKNFERVELEKVSATYSYFDPKKGVALLLDRDLNDLEIPVHLFPQGFERVLQPGDPVTLHKTHTEWISCTLKPEVGLKLQSKA